MDSQGNFNLRDFITQNFAIPVSFEIPTRNVIMIAVALCIAIALGIILGQKGAQALK